MTFEPPADGEFHLSLERWDEEQRAWRALRKDERGLHTAPHSKEQVFVGLEAVRAKESARRRLVDVAIAKIRSARGRLPIRDLAARLDVGERRLERMFRDEVGLAPKHFSRIVRLEAALTALKAGRPQVEVAFDCGYSDQPHLLRDFRAFTGQSPDAYFAGNLAAPLAGQDDE